MLVVLCDFGFYLSYPGVLPPAVSRAGSWIMEYSCVNQHEECFRGWPATKMGLAGSKMYARRQLLVTGSD